MKIKDRPIGGHASPYIIAEAGVHHENDLALAKKYIDAAATAGADAIKFQTYSAARLVTKWAPTYWDDGTGQTQHDIFSKRALLSDGDYQEMAAHAADRGIHFLSTPFDETAVKMLAGLGMPAFKIASADITHHPMLNAVAEHQKPVLLSTGAASFSEIKAAVEVVRAHRAPVAILHCNLSYPTPVAEANLGRIALLRDAFPDVLIGYSDHTQPQDTELTCPLAVGLGACIVEKHFTLDRTLPGDDHYHAVDAAGLARLVKECYNAHAMTNEPLENTPSEKAARDYARRSIVAAKNLTAGTKLSADDLDFKRPGTGIPPSRIDSVVGRILRQDVGQDDLIDASVLRD